MDRRKFITLAASLLATLALAGCVIVANEPKAYIEFHRTGGFASVDQRLTIEADGTGQLHAGGVVSEFRLSADELANLVALFKAAHFASLDAEYRAPGTVLDAFRYEITFNGHTVRTEDTAIPPALEPIITALGNLIRRQIEGHPGPQLPIEPLAGGLLATVRVNDETFRVWVTNEATIAAILALQAGQSTATIPNGTILRGPGEGEHNAPYSWHLDPQDIEMAEVAIEVCDGTPSYVEANVDEFVDNIGRYCPWAAVLVEVRDLRAFIRYQRTGGIAGFNDLLTIDETGRATIVNRGGHVRTILLDAAELQELLDAFKAANFHDLEPVYLPEQAVADAFAYSVTYSGHIVQTADTAVPEALQPVLARLNGLLQRP